MAKTGTDWRARLSLIAACLIFVAWAISFVLDIAVETYEPPASITPLAMSASAFLFGSEVMSKMTPKSPKPEPKPEEVET